MISVWGRPGDARLSFPLRIHRNLIKVPSRQSAYFIVITAYMQNQDSVLVSNQLPAEEQKEQETALSPSGTE